MIASDLTSGKPSKSASNVAAASPGSNASTLTRPPPSTFIGWLLTQRGRDDVAGDLADDVAGFPAMWSLTDLGEISKFIADDGGPDVVQLALGEAWLEWAQRRPPPVVEWFDPRKPITRWANAVRRELS